MVRRLLAQVVSAVGRAARRRELISGQDFAPVWAVLSRMYPEEPTGPPVERNDDWAPIATLFGLTPTEQAVLDVVAAADLDANLALAFGLLNGTGGPQSATIGLALELAGVDLLDPEGRSAIYGTLRVWHLIDAGRADFALGRSLSVPADVIGAMLGEPIPDDAIAAMAVEFSDDPDLSASAPAQLISRVLQAGERVLWITRPPGSAGPALARSACDADDLTHLTLNLDLRPTGLTLVEAVLAGVRWAALSTSCLVLLGGEQLKNAPDAAAAAAVLFRSPVPVLVISNCRWNPAWHPDLPFTVAAPALTPSQRLELWHHHLGDHALPDQWLSGYRMIPESIAAAGRLISARARAEGRPPDRTMAVEAIRMFGGGTGTIDAGTTAPATFDDIEVPAEALGDLRRLAEWVDLRDQVLTRGDVFGLGGKGTGIAALFTGAPGTGKTLAAHVIADATGRELMQVDLAGVVDKYIGETEKNLDRIFAEAESLNVVLFFDEADSLFGRRGEVKDSRDRYANQEVSFLLQRMEIFNGTTILATNLRGNLDPAFARRLHFIVYFPDPDQPTRARLWRSLLRRAGELDLQDPVDIDMLARTVEMAGGDIRNIVLAAAYDAVSERSNLGMRHVLRATVREHGKLGRRLPVLLQAPTA